MYRSRWWGWMALALAGMLGCPAALRAGEGDNQARAPKPAVGTGQPFAKARLPRFRDGRLANEILAGQADAALADPEQPLVHMTDGVLIRLYDLKASAPSGDAPPLTAVRITSDHGAYERRSPGRGRPPEEIVHLEGNVVVTRYFHAAAGRAEPTTIECRYARWNHTRQFLEGKGRVVFRQGDSCITGDDFYYNPGRAVTGGELEGDANGFRDWGGLATIHNNVVMTVSRPATSDGGDGFTGNTDIRCDGLASYNLDDRRIQFEQYVRVERPDIFIATGPGPNGILQATLGENNNIIGFTALHEVSIRSRPRPEAPAASRFEAVGDRADLDFARGFLQLSRYQNADIVEGRRWRGKLPEAILTRPDGAVETVSDAEIVFLLDDPGDGGNNADARSPAAPAAEPAPAISVGDAGTLRELRSSGGLGRAKLAASDDPVTVRYQGPMRYDIRAGDARFEQVDEMIKGDPNMDGLRLSANLIVYARADEGREPALSAEGDARLRRGDWSAAADFMTIDPSADILRLRSRREGETPTSPGTPIPPFPRMSNPVQGVSFEAPNLDLARRVGGDGQPFTHLDGGGGPCVSVLRPGAPADAPGAAGVAVPGVDVGDGRRAIRITADDSMQFYEDRRLATFLGKRAPIIAESTDPDEAFTLACAQLFIEIAEPETALRPGGSAGAGASSDSVLDPSRWRPRRIVALGDHQGRWAARLLRGDLECEGAQIDQIERGPGVYTVQVETDTTDPDRKIPSYPARIREDGGRGIIFAAPRLGSDMKGTRIVGEGAGRLDIPDHGDRAVVTFAEHGEYIRPVGSARAFTRFFRDVRLTRKALGMEIACDIMDVHLIPPGASDGNIDPAEGDRVHLERAWAYGRRDADGRYLDAEGGVHLRHNTGRVNVTRQAWADWGQAQFLPFGGAVIHLYAHTQQDPGRRIRLVDSDGYRLSAPRAQAVMTTNILRADGPGEVIVPGLRQADGSNGGRMTVARYRDRLTYSEVRDLIRLDGQVTAQIGDILFGQGEILQLHTRPRPDSVAGEDSPPLEVRRVELWGRRGASGAAEGFAEIWRYPDPNPARPDLPPERRVGRTGKARAAHAACEVESEKMVLEGKVGRHAPQALYQLIESDGAGGSGRIQKIRLVQPQRIDFDLAQPTAAASIKGAEWKMMGSGEPLVFDDTK